MHPSARRTGTITQDVDGDLVVYDTVHHVAHRLTASAARVWEHCDGGTSVAEIAHRIGTAAEPVDEATVQAALHALREANLLIDGETPQALTRRTAVRRMAQVAGSALSVPLVISIAAPTPADALSGGGNGGTRGNRGRRPSSPPPRSKGKP